jgi:hypothetical protein|tara:strand:- start:203 stop:481 length:279 start_codon:yes stop_codon:yes gene_type:complete
MQTQQYVARGVLPSKNAWDLEGLKVSTNEELAKLMLKHNLTGQDVADLIEVTLSSVINWGRISRPTAMPRVALLALRLSIESGRLSELEKPT